MSCAIDLYNNEFIIHVNFAKYFVILLFGPNLRGLYEMFVNISKLCHISLGNRRGLRISE